MRPLYFRAIAAVLVILLFWIFFFEQEISQQQNVPCPPTEYILDQNKSSKHTLAYIFNEEEENITRERVIQISTSKGESKLKYGDSTWQICLMVRNQAREMREWIEWHALMGATHISIYNHENTDNTEEVVKMYLNENIRKHDPFFPKVELIQWPPKEEIDNVLSANRKFLNDEENIDTVSKIAICKTGIGNHEASAGGRCQIAAIADCATRFRSKRDWISWHDIDEFFWVTNQTLLENDTRHSVSSYFDTLNPAFPGIYLKSFTFGTSGLKNRSDYEGQLVMESHTHRSPIENLGENEELIIAQNPNCAKNSAGWGVCKRGGGKPIIRGGKNAKWDTKSTTPHEVRSVYVEFLPESAMLRMNHYQMKSLEDSLEASKKQNKFASYESVLFAEEFWNNITDTGIIEFIPEIKKRIAARESFHRESL